MKLPYCKICGECHALGRCPLWDEPPEPKYAPKTVPKAAQAVQHHQAEAPPDAFAQGRPFTPDDMKQEYMPVHRPRFDRSAYQRELMRKRRFNERNQPEHSEAGE
jgi:hypothetical protein